jgi:hypothetical protein
MKLAQSCSDDSVLPEVSMSMGDAMSSARGRLAGMRDQNRTTGKRGSGTHQNRTSSVIRRADSRGIDDRRTWDASLCVVGNP